MLNDSVFRFFETLAVVHTQGPPPVEASVQPKCMMEMICHRGPTMATMAAMADGRSLKWKQGEVSH